MRKSGAATGRASAAGGKSEGTSDGWRYVDDAFADYPVPGPSVLGPEGQRLVFSPGKGSCSTMELPDPDRRGACLIATLYDEGDLDPGPGSFVMAPRLVVADFTSPPLFNKATVMIYGPDRGRESRRSFEAWIEPILLAEDAPWAEWGEFVECLRGLAGGGVSAESDLVGCRDEFEKDVENRFSGRSNASPTDLEPCVGEQGDRFVGAQYIAAVYDVLRAVWLPPIPSSSSLDIESVRVENPLVAWVAARQGARAAQCLR